MLEIKSYIEMSAEILYVPSFYIDLYLFAIGIFDQFGSNQLFTINSSFLKHSSTLMCQIYFIMT